MPADERTTDPELQVFFDGACPLCRREIGWLKRRDRNQRVVFMDIAAGDFDPREVGKTQRELMESFHARRPDGTWLTGVTAFERLYASVGLGFVFWPTRLPGIRQLATAAYALFAANRLAFTGRSCSLDAPGAGCNHAP
jgi:predicted DCC family thiol-disulfide oxidoreductase YuxK